MNLPGSYQDGINANLLKKLPWWRFQPHPEWISPHGTTLLEPNDKITGFDIDLMSAFASGGENDGPGGEWRNRKGNFHFPYCAGIPGEVRVIYMPAFGLIPPSPPTIFGLEPNIRYRVYYWEPTMGIKVDIGTAALPEPGEVVFQDAFQASATTEWTDNGGKTARTGGRLSMTGTALSVVGHAPSADLVVAVSARGNSDAGLVLRYHDADNYVAAIYSGRDKAIYLLNRTKGVDGPRLGVTPVPALGSNVRLKAEAREDAVAMSVTDGERTYSSPIVTITNTTAGQAGLLHREDDAESFADFELRKSPAVEVDAHLPRKLYDAKGNYRGNMEGEGVHAMGLDRGWSGYGLNKRILLDAYMPDHLPTSGDWVLVMEKQR
jgi:hypothetical protein